MAFRPSTGIDHSCNIEEGERQTEDFSLMLVWYAIANMPYTLVDGSFSIFHIFPERKVYIWRSSWIKARQSISKIYLHWPAPYALKSN